MKDQKGKLCKTLTLKHLVLTKSSHILNPFMTNVPHLLIPASLLKMLLFHRCFSNILLVKTNSWFVHKRNLVENGLNQFVYVCMTF